MAELCLGSPKSVWGYSWHLSRSSPHGMCQEVEGYNIGSSVRESCLETQEATSRSKRLSVTSRSIGTWMECRLQLSSWLLKVLFEVFVDCVFFSSHLMITRGTAPLAWELSRSAPPLLLSAGEHSRAGLQRTIAFRKDFFLCYSPWGPSPSCEVSYSIQTVI